MANFWNEKIVEPKRKFRWLMSVQGIEFFTIKKVTRPQITITEAEHKFINHTFYFPGRVTYNEIDFTIVDTASPDAAETLRQIIHAGGYRLPKSADIATQSITKHGAVAALGMVEINLLGGGGNAAGIGSGTGSGAGTGTVSGINDEGQVIEAWTLHNAWVKDISFSELDYDGDDLAEITIKLRYDFAELNRPGVTPFAGKLGVEAPVGTAFTPAAIGEDPKRQD
jgi:hypothetical protein